MILLPVRGNCWLTSIVSKPLAKSLFTWLKVEIYCSTCCKRLWIEVSVLLSVCNTESRECFNFRSVSLKFLGFFFLACAKLSCTHKVVKTSMVKTIVLAILYIDKFTKNKVEAYY